MEFVKKVALIKEEYACMSKDAQKVSLSTAECREEIQRIEYSIEKIEEILDEEAQMIIKSKIYIADEELKKRLVQEQLEIVTADRLAALQKLASATTNWNEVAKQALNLKSPDDYKRELLHSAKNIDALKRQVAEERSLNGNLSRQLEERKKAETRLKETRREVEQLKLLLASVQRDVATMEASIKSRSPSPDSADELRLQLREAQDQYAYLAKVYEMYSGTQ